MNRVICGHHWKSDTDASLLLAATMFANVVCTDETDAATRSAAIYDLNGRQLNTQPDNGVYIQDGEKRIAR